MWLKLDNFIITPKFNLELINREKTIYTIVEFPQAFVFIPNISWVNAIAQLCHKTCLYFNNEKFHLCMFCKDSLLCLFQKDYKKNFVPDENETQYFETLTPTLPEIVTKTLHLPVFSILPAKYLFKMYNPLKVAVSIEDIDILKILFQKLIGSNSNLFMDPVATAELYPVFEIMKKDQYKITLFMDTVSFELDSLKKNLKSSLKLFSPENQLETMTLITSTPAILNYIYEGKKPEEESEINMYSRFITKLMELTAKLSSFTDSKEFNEYVYQLKI